MNDSEFETMSEDEAASWVARLHSPEADRDDHAAFEAWLSKDDANPVRYAAAERLHAMAKLVQRRATAEVVRLPVRRPERSHFYRAALGLAACLCAALGIAGWMLMKAHSSVSYATTIGSPKAIVLTDGTRLVMDGDTAVEARIDEGSRHIELKRGRIEVAVAPSPVRLEVGVDGATIRDVGTVFQVERSEAGARLALIEGEVELRPSFEVRVYTLAPGQRVHFDQQRVGPLETVDLAAVRGWVDGRLVFRHASLSEVLAQVNRYAEPRLVLADPSLAEVKVSGNVLATDRPGLLRILAEGWGIQSRRSSDGSVELYRPMPR